MRMVVCNRTPSMAYRFVRPVYRSLYQVWCWCSGPWRGSQGRPTACFGIMCGITNLVSPSCMRRCTPDMVYCSVLSFMWVIVETQVLRSPRSGWPAPQVSGARPFLRCAVVPTVTSRRTFGMSRLWSGRVLRSTRLVVADMVQWHEVVISPWLLGRDLPSHSVSQGCLAETYSVASPRRVDCFFEEVVGLIRVPGSWVLDISQPCLGLGFFHF
jgi:hypothetical protein